MISIGTTVYYQFGLDSYDLNSITEVKIYKGVVTEIMDIEVINSGIRKNVRVCRIDNSPICFDEELLHLSLEEEKKYLKEHIEAIVNLKLALALKNIEEDKGE